MQFCPECGMRIVKAVEKDGKNFGTCVNGHITPLPNTVPIITKKITHESGIIIDEGKQLEGGTITSIPCPNCGGRRSRLINSFMLYGDEDQVNIMKCLDCGKNFRVGKGVSG